MSTGVVLTKDRTWVLIPIFCSFRIPSCLDGNSIQTPPSPHNADILLKVSNQMCEHGLPYHKPYISTFLRPSSVRTILPCQLGARQSRSNQLLHDAQCSAYNGEVAAWRSKKPEIALLSLGLEGNCIDFKMSGTSKSVSVAAMWGYVAGNSQTQNQRCDFFRRT